MSICARRCEEALLWFDLSDPKTSVSMTINGPAPMLLGDFPVNAAIIRQARNTSVRTDCFPQAAEGAQTELHGHWVRAQRDQARPRGGRSPRARRYHGGISRNDGLGLLLLVAPGVLRACRDVRVTSAEIRCNKCAAPCRPTSLKRTRRRTPASSHRFALQGDGRRPAVVHRPEGAQLLPVSIGGTTSPRPARTPSRRSWPSPRPTASPTSSTTAGYGHRRVRAEPEFFFSNGMDPSTRHRPRGRASGPGPCASATAPTSAARC